MLPSLAVFALVPLCLALSAASAAMNRRASDIDRAILVSGDRAFASTMQGERRRCLAVRTLLGNLAFASALSWAIGLAVVAI